MKMRSCIHRECPTSRWKTSRNLPSPTRNLDLRTSYLLEGTETSCTCARCSLELEAIEAEVSRILYDVKTSRREVTYHAGSSKLTQAHAARHYPVLFKRGASLYPEGQQSILRALLAARYPSYEPVFTAFLTHATSPSAWGPKPDGCVMAQNRDQLLSRAPDFQVAMRVKHIVEET
jgi:hypothetical protein